MGLLPTDLIIKELCIRTGEPGFHNYGAIEGLMLDAIRDINIYTMPCWSVANLSLTTFNTVGWPCDLVKPLVTALKRNGNYYLLEISDSLIDTLKPNLTSDSEQEIDVTQLPNIDQYIQDYGWGVWSWDLGELYGSTNMKPAFGKIIHDYKNRQSFIKNCKIKTGDTVTMFFKSDGVQKTPLYIPSEAKDVVEYYILQKYYMIANPNLSSRMEQMYKERLFRLSRFLDDNSEDGWIRSMNSNTISSPKI